MKFKIIKKNYDLFGFQIKDTKRCLEYENGVDSDVVKNN